MITNFKIFENVLPIDIGDYILVEVKESTYFSSSQAFYMNSHLGKVVNITNDATQFQLDYDENLGNFGGDLIQHKHPWILNSEVGWYGKNKIDIETIKQSKIYNL